MIEIFCDNSRHARQKVATVATYYRDIQGKWSRRIGDRCRQWEKRSAQHPELSGNAALLHMFGPDQFAPAECKLCGRKLPLWSDNVLSPVLDQLAGQGVSRVSMRRLNLLASKQAKG